jgi:5-(carboxyamino)imidazole ribonucleotide mutase
MAESPTPLVAVIMGSSSDWETMKGAADVLERFGVAHEAHIVSAHRTPVWMAEFATGAEAKGYEVIIAGAGGAAHLPGMVAAQTVLPVLGVPVQSAALQGLDSLLSIVQMPAGVPVVASSGWPSASSGSCRAKRSFWRGGRRTCQCCRTPTRLRLVPPPHRSV